MIKITKPEQAPEILRTRGQEKRQSHCDEYIQYPTEYANGKRKFAFDSKIYGDVTVKQALIDAQHGKCAFCERQFGNDGDVEHFRPKAACRDKNGPLIRPGYYWLAYDWDNLLLACAFCNQRFKRNHFPITNATHRAKSHADDVVHEEPLFIHPAKMDPEQYITFNKQIPVAIGNNPYGVTTIKNLSLNRKILNEQRDFHLRVLIQMRNTVECEEDLVKSEKGRQLLERAKIFLSQSIQDSAEFASMARAAAKADYYLAAS